MKFASQWVGSSWCDRASRVFKTTRLCRWFQGDKILRSNTAIFLQYIVDRSPKPVAETVSWFIEVYWVWSWLLGRNTPYLHTYTYIYILFGYAYTLAWIHRLICMYTHILYVSFIVHRDVRIIIWKLRKLLFLIKSFSSALIRSISFSRFILASNAWPYELPCSSPCGLHSQVELAQNDVVFCAGGVAEASYLVLSFLTALDGWLSYQVW